MNCQHAKIVCDKAERVYKCAECGHVIGHFWTPATVTIPAGVVAVGNGLYTKAGA